SFAGGDPADCGAACGQWPLHSDSWGTASARFKDGRQGDDSGDGEAGLGAAGGGDDDRREPATRRSDVHGAGGGVRASEQAIQPDTRRDRETCRTFARVSVELSAAPETAGAGTELPAEGRTVL